MADPLYVQARKVLLDALDAVQAHLDSIVLVGAQAIYLHAGEGDLAVAPYTTDADLSLDPRVLDDDPLLDEALRAAGFAHEGNPGQWVSPSAVVVDLMVPEALAAGTSRRNADITPHAKNTARRAAGLEAAVVDKSQREIGALDPADERRYRLWVAGPAALLVAKTHKIHERVGDENRTRHKDALDVLRLLRAVEAGDVARTLGRLLESDVAGDATRQAVTWMPELFGSRSSDGVESAVIAAGPSENPDTIAYSLITLVDDVLGQL